MNADFKIGFKLAERYEIREVLGEGTLGATYKAYDNNVSRNVVVKALPATFRKKEQLSKRFIEHYRGLLKRDHEGFARVFDVSIQEGIPFAIIEYLEGLSLRQLIQVRNEEKKPFSFEEAESIVEEIGQVLSWLHLRAFHGALKPENVFILPDRIKLNDDGLMDILPPEVFARVQVRNPVAAPYCSPELLSEPNAIGREVDVFGLAAITYELLTGTPPALEAQGLEKKRSDSPAGVERVIRKGMMDPPAKRYPTINTFLLDLARLGNDKHKVQVLQAVVEAEAAEEAERTMSQLRTSEAEAKQAAATLAAKQKEAAKPAADVSQLFLDETLPARLPDMAIAEPAHRPSTSTQAARAGESTDLLAPTPTISSTGDLRRRKWVFVAVAAGVAIVGIAGFFALRQGPLSTPGEATSPAVPITNPTVAAAPAAAVAAIDSRAAEVVDKALAEVQKKRETLANERSDLRGHEKWVDIAGLITDAVTAKGAAQYDTALQLLRMVDSELSALAKIEPPKSIKTGDAPPAKVAAARVPVETSVQQPAAEPPAVKSGSKEKKSCGEDMVLIPAGPFMAGSPAEDLLRDPMERSFEKQTVAAFCIDRYEFPNKKGARPKIKLSQQKAEAECAQVGKRLCSELEWEKVCKGPRNNDYPYGKVWDPNACNTETATGEDRALAPTGSKAQCKSDYDVYDLSGNVLEWTSSRFEQNKSQAIAKGGSYMRPDYAARCAYRYSTPAATEDAEIGFRCCSDAD